MPRSEKDASLTAMLDQDWNSLGIRRLEPGFYDDPSFIAAEQDGRPDLLVEYARYVTTKRYDPDYISGVRQLIGLFASFLAPFIASATAPGSCMFVSQMVSRILDEHGIWNYVVAGGTLVTPLPVGVLPPIPFVPEEDRENHIFRGHAWVVAPPFRIVDLTIEAQAYPAEYRKHVKGPVLEESPRPLVRRLSPDHNFPDAFTQELHGAMVTLPTAVYEYAPCAIRPSIEPLERMPLPDFAGQKPADIYSRWRRSIDQPR